VSVLHHHQRQWKLVPEDRAQTRALAEALNVPPVVAHLLLSRGMTTPDECRLFLSPAETHLCDPFALTDMDAAVARLQRARERGEHVRVFGDYDVDGIAGTALLYRALQRFGIIACSYGMPSRLTEGYGLNPEQVALAKEEGVRLIVTVDNGIAAHEAAAEAVRLGVELIVTDHHEIERGLPPAVAVINPKRDGVDGPLYSIAGAGVALKLAHALTGELCDLDLAALGTVADVVPLRGENRIITALGLHQMRHDNRVGVEELAQVARLNLKEITAGDIAFQLGPRINAGGRLGNGLIGLELLLTEDRRLAADLARQLDDANTERRSIERVIFDDALAMLGESFHDDQRSIVLGRDGWHSGVIGIVASRLQQRYYRPVVLVAMEEDGAGRGSARGIDGFDIAAALSCCQDHLAKFGGHKAAGGLSLHANRFDDFRIMFEAEARRQLPEMPEKILRLDAQVALSEVDARLVRLLEQLEPFGEGHPQPVFCCYGVEAMPNSVRPLKNNHVKATFCQNGKALPAIGFNLADRLTPELAGRPIDIAFTPSFNTWRGETTVQIQLRDVRVSPQS
jgi:single-stranded-DNA-specific exonuclease